MNPLRVLGNGLEALVGAGGRGKKNGREAGAAHLGEILLGFFDDHVDDEDAVGAGGLCIVGKAGEAEAEDGIEVSENNEAGGGAGGANVARDGENVSQTRAAGESALAGALDDGTIAERVAERDAELDDVCARVNGGDGDAAGRVERRIAGRQVRNQARFLMEDDRHRGSGPLDVQLTSENAHVLIAASGEVHYKYVTRAH